ncbi:MAG TPA: DNA-directed RNA polymerase subunit alpha C-terminal domain-containing protein [Polyangiaceae bacterium LLY-WYZ-15_(1-7)]|nr:DNA-directed RNA polymerase subunit alpha C-terminal domain-containing protein [Polyangiaceae bacterium LLY-WYZ-15_(1-7)]HJL08725.1 DNA-directed RNA polymerase subunit alpha C-terminal domain-containing protein [Polyangiaceae bacterium LLY-WYZ-15_(1-7)]HJL36634.1 DNA-directed RNA polymerase subunit alpha C-terminal domain-containing protein [Polyangiaceae bacterium LLY-WYZ-15_(1-7)]
MVAPLVLEESRETSVELLLVSRPGVLGVQVARAAAPRLASRHVKRFERAIVKDGRESFTRAVPNAGADALEHLDEDGLVAEGAEVRPGDILVGCREDDPVQLNPEEKLLRAIFGERAGARDASLRCSPDAKGRVSAVRRETTKSGERVEVELTDVRPLRVGDVLALDGREAVVTAIVDDLEGDLAWSGVGGRVRVEKRADAEGALEARSIGPYSLVTQQPLGGKARFGGQRVRDPQLRALEGAGAWHAAHEMLTLKCDDVSGRARLFEGIVRGDTAGVEPGPSELRRVLVRELEAMGFALEELEERPSDPEPRATEGGPPGGGGQVGSGGSVDVFSFFGASTGDRPDSPPPAPKPAPAGGPRDVFSFFEKPETHVLAALRLGISTDDRIRERSHGEVTKPETINYRTLKPEPGGLFCARIFGPVKDYECACGKYARMKHRGIVCEVCGVEVIASRVRGERFGHIRFPVPVLHPWARDAVAAHLGRPVEDVDRILDGQLDLALQEPASWREGGPFALRAALGEVGARYFFEVWPVLPPDLRPLLALGGGRFATSDLNDLYRRVVNRKNRLARLIELDAPVVILRNEMRQLQEGVEALVANGERARPVIGPQGKKLVALVDLAHGRLTHPFERGRRVDFSGAARAVPLPELSPDTVRLPRSMALELFKPWLYGRLELRGYTTTIKAAKRMVEAAKPEVLEELETGVAGHPVLVGARGGSALAGVKVELWDELAIGASPALLGQLALAPGGVAVVHVPATAAAIREVRQLGVAREAAPDPAPEGFLAEAIRSEALGPTLFEAARRGAVDGLRHPATRRLLGLLGDESAVATPDEEGTWDAPGPPRPEEAPGALSPWLFRRVAELELPAPAHAALERAGVVLLGDLVQKTDAEVLKTRGFGRRSLLELKTILADLGLGLGTRLPPGWRDQAPR